MAKEKLIVEGPGDVKEKPEVLSYRGDKGESESMKHTAEEPKDIDGYDR